MCPWGNQYKEKHVSHFIQKLVSHLLCNISSLKPLVRGDAIPPPNWDDDAPRAQQGDKIHVIPYLLKNKTSK